MKILLHQKPPTDFKGLASKVTFVPSGELAWPKMRSTRTAEENLAASRRIHAILARNGQRPS